MALSEQIKIPDVMRYMYSAQVSSVDSVSGENVCRGQVMRVKAPWIKHYYNNNGQFYVIPNLETVVLGGTTQKDDWNTTISEQVS